MPPKVALITGVCGQDDSYLTELLLSKGYIVHGQIWPSWLYYMLKFPQIIKRRIRSPAVF